MAAPELETKPPKPSKSQKGEVVLSLISHTNVGKTALARTLLRRDVGEVADSAHVTVVPEAYELISDGGWTARLWDTPGFGANLAKLAKRLRSSENPVGWILREVWDRHRDKSLWCSQQAVRNVREDADVVFYLVDASREPGETGYLDLELEVLSWIGKPVLVFLNQTGPPDPEKDRTRMEAWRSHLSRHETVRGVAALDAFTRCWTEEHRLLEKAAAVLEGAPAEAARRLAQAWAQRNLGVFDEAVSVLAVWAWASLADTEALPGEGLADKLRTLLVAKRRNAELDRAQERLRQRLAERTSTAVTGLVALYGLEGESAAALESAGRHDYEVRRRLGEGASAFAGGSITAIPGGLAVDLASSGLSFGTGAVVAAIAGGVGGYAIAKGYNLALVGADSVRWGKGHFLAQAKFVAMLYLAVSHYGRGRGRWQDPVHRPERWQTMIEERFEAERELWADLWKAAAPKPGWKGGFGSAGGGEKLERRIRERFRETLGALLGDLHPESAALFAGAKGKAGEAVPPRERSGGAV